VYLLSNGLQFEFVYANKIRRYVKGNPEHTFHNVASFLNKFEEDIKNNKVKAYKGTRFPKNADIALS